MLLVTLWSSPRLISTSQLNTLLCLHLWPINLVVYKESYCFRMGNLVFRLASRLDAFSVYPFQTWLFCCGIGYQQIHQRFVHPGPLVLRTAPIKFPTPTTDRDRTVSRRSEPSSRTAFTLFEWFPIILRRPLSASVTLSEATAPVKLPA